MQEDYGDVFRGKPEKPKKKKMKDNTNDFATGIENPFPSGLVEDQINFVSSSRPINSTSKSQIPTYTPALTEENIESLLTSRGFDLNKEYSLTDICELLNKMSAPEMFNQAIFNEISQGFKGPNVKLDDFVESYLKNYHTYIAKIKELGQTNQGLNSQLDGLREAVMRNSQNQEQATAKITQLENEIYENNQDAILLGKTVMEMERPFQMRNTYTKNETFAVGIDYTNKIEGKILKATGQSSIKWGKALTVLCMILLPFVCISFLGRYDVLTVRNISFKILGDDSFRHRRLSFE